MLPTGGASPAFLDSGDFYGKANRKENIAKISGFYAVTRNNLIRGACFLNIKPVRAFQCKRNRSNFAIATCAQSALLKLSPSIQK